jgi:prolyl 4-hydroxylase
MITLNTVEKGGHTHFPKLNQTIEPTPGQAIIWYNLADDHLAHPLSLHGELAIEKGEKFIITQWFREFPHFDSAQ